MKPDKLSSAVQPVLSRLDAMEAELVKQLEALAGGGRARHRRISFAAAAWTFGLLSAALAALVVFQVFN